MIKIYDKLYKRNTNGSIQVWWVEQNGAKFRSISGQVNGKMVETLWRETEATNVGRSNARDIIEQATFEIESSYKKKLETNYTKDINSVDNTDFFKVMLAKSYSEKELNKAKSNRIFSQPKLDGVRCIVTSDGAFSRSGKEFVSIPHIIEALKPLFENNPDLILDGELYNHVYKDNFNQIISMVRKTKPNEEDLIESAKYAEYWVYDVVSDEPYSVRYDMLTNLVSGIEHISVIPNHVVSSDIEIMEKYENYVADGYEGQMLRVDSVGYEHKRTSNLLKHKSFDDSEYEIVSIEEGTGNRSGMAGYVVCALPDGRIFHAGAIGTFEECIELYEKRDEYVGGQVTVQHFRLTPDGIPRFPKAKAYFMNSRDM